MLQQRVIDLAAKELKLKGWLKTKLPRAEDLSISPLQRAGLGLGNETHLFDLHWREDGKEKTEGLVVRWPPESFPYFAESDLSLQFRVMQCLKDSGIPVPKVYWLEEDASILGVPFYVMERIDGEIIPDRMHGQGLLYEATPERRAQICWRTLETLAKIHSLDWKRLGLSFLGVPKGGTDSLDQQIAYWERHFRWSARETFPVLEAGFEWVKKNRYSPKRVCLCWGDARPAANMIFRDDKVAAVLDWEWAHIGPPESDLFFAIYFDESSADAFGHPRLAGLPTMEETISYYERCAGKGLENLFYYQVFTALKIGIVAIQLAKVTDDLKIPGFPPDFAQNNWGTRKLEELLSAKSRF